MTSPTKPLLLRVARIIATVLSRFVVPVTVFKTTGIMPYVEAQTVPHILRAYADTPLFTEPPPSSSGGKLVWSASQRKRPSKTHLASVPSGIVFPTGAVFDHRGQFVEMVSHDYDFLDNPQQKKHRFVLRPHRVFPRIHRFRHDVVTLTASNQKFYFHWIFEILPRLWLAEQAGCGGGPFFVEAELPFQQQTLGVLGVTEPRRIDPLEMGAISASNLIIPCHRIAPGHAFPEWSIRFLRDRLLPKANEGRRSSPKRLYVSRRNARHRRVLNEPEIVSFLAGYGFQSIQAEELTFCDQMSLFRDAEIVIAPHGGGLANLVFCTPGAKVIELFPPVNIDLYYRFATQLGLNYLFVKSGDSPLTFMRPEDYHIDLAELKTVLDGAM